MIGRRVLPAVTVALILTGTACSEAPPAPHVRVRDPWVRTSTGEGANSAAYMTVLNAGKRPQRLVGARCDAARAAQLHRTTIDDSGMARMGEVESVEIPAEGRLVLEPGGYHLMLMGVGSLVEGDTVELTLRFEGADSIRVRAPVRPL